MQTHILRLGLDTSHWVDGSVQPGQPPAVRAPVAIDDQALQRLLPEVRSLARLLVGLGLDPGNGAAYRRVKRRIRRLGLSTDHLAGQAWARGGGGTRRPRPLDEILVRNSTYISSSALRDRLVAEGVLPWECASCGITEWQGQRAPLQLDHVNGDPTDNRRENLRLLCPNCHAQTSTYCGRNIGNRYSPGSGSG